MVCSSDHQKNFQYRITFSLSIYDSNESIDVVHGESNFFIEVMHELGLFIDK
jgi:hypothetical protein